MPVSSSTARIYIESADPTVNSDSANGFEIGNFWYNDLTAKHFQADDVGVGAAVWKQFLMSGVVVDVPDGGTGQVTLLDHGVLVGSGTNPVTSLSVGATGTILAGNTGADPAFTATPSLTSITLGGGTAFSNYLEQQSWTPSIVGLSTAGTGTYTLQSGYYTRIGNMIFLQCEITWTAHTGTGDLTIANLPFTVRNSANYSPEGIINTQNMTLPGGANRTSIGSASAGNTYIAVYVAVNGGANSPIQMQASGNIHATIAYLT